MGTYLLTWNPNRWQWDMDEDLTMLKAYGYFDGRWSSGGTKRIEPGDRVYLLRQGVEPRGIMASGTATSFVYPDKHWDESREDSANYIEVRFDSLLDPEVDGVLPLSVLNTGPTSRTNWTPQASGTTIDPISASHLDILWSSFLEANGQSPINLPDEIPTPEAFFEGASRRIAVNSYERNPRARKACIDYYGSTCFVCGFDFASRYMGIGDGFIHVHHLVPIASIGNDYTVNPIRDLRPVCPNCHAMIHRSPSSALSIEDLQSLLQ